MSGRLLRLGAERKTLLLHWTGSKWKAVRSPNPSTTANYPYAVVALSGTDAWTVGEYFKSSVVDTLALHWDGTGWKKT